MEEEIIKLLNDLINLNKHSSWFEPSVVIGLLTLLSSIIVSIFMYRVSKNQKDISKKQQEIQYKEFKYALFDKRYEIYKITFLLQKKVALDEQLLDAEYKEKFEDCIASSEFLFNKEVSNILNELYELALIGDKIKLIYKKEHSAEELITQEDLQKLKWNITLDNFLKLGQFEQWISLDERRCIIPMLIKDEHLKVFKEYLKID